MIEYLVLTLNSRGTHVNNVLRKVTMDVKINNDFDFIPYFISRSHSNMAE